MELFWKSAKILVFFIFLCVSCSTSSSSLSGYIEGEYTYISSGVAGTLFNVLVSRGQSVKKGDLLYQLDPEPEKSNVEVIQNNIGSLQPQVDFAKKQLERQKQLYARNTTPKASVDQAQSDFDSKSKQLDSLKAQLKETEWSLNQKTIYSPITGEVFDTFYYVGEKVPENHPVLSILAPEYIRVLFYVPESLLSKIKLGQTIAFSCDSCNKKTLAKISYISPEAEYTPPVIYSKDTRNKLVYLIRADMPANIAKNFHPGQPIDVYLNP